MKIKYNFLEKIIKEEIYKIIKEEIPGDMNDQIMLLRDLLSNPEKNLESLYEFWTMADEGMVQQYMTEHLPEELLSSLILTEKIKKKLPDSNLFFNNGIIEISQEQVIDQAYDNDFEQINIYQNYDFTIDPRIIKFEVEKAANRYDNKWNNHLSNHDEVLKELDMFMKDEFPDEDELNFTDSNQERDIPF